VLRPDQLAELRQRITRWEGQPPPCGIPPAHPYSPCLPEQDEDGLWCATCFLPQRLALPPGGTR
jgi:hypothetical protein